MEPTSGIILLLTIVLIITVTFLMHKNDELQNLEEKIDDLYSDIQLLEIREMRLKDQLKDAMTEADFLYS